MDHMGKPSSTRKSKRMRSREEVVKVVYISSPVKVKTSASGFRALVQELTGRDSDASRLVETQAVDGSESPTSSQSLLEPCCSNGDELITTNKNSPSPVKEEEEEESFLGMFPSSLLSFQASELDELGGGYYDAISSHSFGGHLMY